MHKYNIGTRVINKFSLNHGVITKISDHYYYEWMRDNDKKIFMASDNALMLEFQAVEDGPITYA